MKSITIEKPLYGNFCYIRETFLKNAIKDGEVVEVKLPNMTAIISPREWIKTGKVMKKVFNFPDNPMILWGNDPNKVKVKKSAPLPKTDKDWMIAVGAL